MTRRLTNDEFLEKLATVNTDIEPMEEYVTSSTKIKFHCKVCGHVWETRPNNILSKGQGCPKCGHKKGAISMAQTKRKSHDQFVDELATVNDKVKVIGTYRQAKYRVEVECVECGRRWMAFPGNLLRGNGCQVCAGKHHRMTEDEFVSRLADVNPNLDLVSGYTMASEKALFKCRVCGHEWSVAPTSLLRGSGCPECGKTRLSEMHQKSPEEYARQFAEANKTLRLLSEYKGSDKHVEVECTVCGYRWSTSAQHLLGDTGCPKCAGNMQLTNDEFLERISAINPDVMPKTEYVNGDTRINCQCRKCGHEWTTSAGALLGGTGCPSCAGNMAKTNDEFVSELAELNDTITPLEEYKGASTPIKMRCNRCGKVWSAKPYALLHGGGCPECCIARRSFFEHAILYAARDSLGEDQVLSRDKSAIGVELDVYVPSLKVAFEPGSWFYHKNRVISDKKKQILCRDAGIRLYTIYTSYKEIAPAPDWSIATSLVLGSSEWDSAREMIVRLFDDCGIVTDEINWKRVYSRAVRHSGRRTTKQFIDELSDINPNVEVLGNYTSASDRVEVRCKRCGHVWNPAASSLLNGYGCPNCSAIEAGNRNRKTQQQFIEEVEAKNLQPRVEIVGEYKGWDYNIHVRCSECGYEWNPRAGYLLIGHSCPRCNNRLRKSHEEFVSDMEQVNPNVQILNRYYNNHTYIDAKCLVCGNEWTTAAANLLSGRGCPVCGRKRSDEARKKTNDEFVRQLAERSPDVEAVGEYRYAREKMEFRCVKCGHHWFATPDNILRGRGCPKCKYKKNK